MLTTVTETVLSLRAAVTFSSECPKSSKYSIVASRTFVFCCAVTVQKATCVAMLYELCFTRANSSNVFSTIEKLLKITTLFAGVPL